MIIKIDDRQLKKFEKAMKDAPKECQNITAGLLNYLAFKTREYNIKNISEMMVIRNPRFMIGSIKVEKANKNYTINQQIANVGSINRPRFSGWREQQFNTIPKTRRGWAPGARDFNYKSQTVGKARLRPNQKFKRPTDFNFPKVKSENQKIGLFLKIMMDRKNKSGAMREGKSFIIPKYKGFEYGLYNYQNGKFVKYQDFEKANKPVKRKPWMEKSIAELRVKHKLDEMWMKAIKRIIKLV